MKSVVLLNIYNNSKSIGKKVFSVTAATLSADILSFSMSTTLLELTPLSVEKGFIVVQNVILSVIFLRLNLE